MKKKNWKKIQEGLYKKGLIDEETLKAIDTELQIFLDTELEDKTTAIKKLLMERKNVDSGNFSNMVS